MTEIEERSPIIRHPGDGPTVSTGPLQVRYLVEQEDGVPWSMIHYTAPAGFGPPAVLHRHTRETAAFYILDGALEMTFMHGTERLDPGALVVLPPGCWFRWRNANEDRSASWLNIFAPAGFEQFFREVVEAVESRGGADPAVIAEVLPPSRAKYGDQDHPEGLS
ncbi:MAG: cupin domain-containing protein [Dehalococcoidia bacterium]|nr:cupin domain-containing protein [Dehalococcoidia bacterium]